MRNSKFVFQKMGLLVLVLLSVVTLGACQGLFRLESSASKHEFLRAGLLSRGWRELKRSRQVDPGFLWTFRWNPSESPPRQMVNHFANNVALTSKWGLLASLKDSSCFPRGYLLPRDAQLLAEDFHRTAASCAGEQVDASPTLPPLQPSIDCGLAMGKMWIAKPASGTRGVGIEVFRDLQAVEQFVSSQQGEFVVQKYIESPLLLFDRKVKRTF